MELSAIRKPTLKGPNVFRQLVPAIVEDFVHQIEQLRYSKHLPGSPLRMAEVAGSRAGNASWEITTERVYEYQSVAAGFTLFINGRKEARIHQIECRLIVRSPSGAVLKEFGWQKGKLAQGPADSDDEDEYRFCERDPSLSDYDDVDSVSVKQAKKHRWLFHGALHVCADVLFELMPAPPPRPIAANTTGESIMVMMRSVLGDPRFSDFVLMSSDGQQINTHKFLLAAVSPVFRAMFDTVCRETREGCCEVEDADGETIQAMLACVLGARVCDFGQMGFDLLLKLSILADKYGIPGLKEDCEAQLEPNVSMDNVFDLLAYADRYSSLPLKTAGFTLLEDTMDTTMLDIDKLVDRLKEKEGSADRPLHEEFLDHVHLRKTGQSLQQAMSKEYADDEEHADEAFEAEFTEDLNLQLLFS